MQAMMQSKGTMLSSPVTAVTTRRNSAVNLDSIMMMKREETKESEREEDIDNDYGFKAFDEPNLVRFQNLETKVTSLGNQYSKITQEIP
jgi:hypothetical protein